MEPILKPTVFIQTNPRQRVGARVGAYSLRRNSANPQAFDVRIMDTTGYPFFQAREGRKYLRGGAVRRWWNEDLQSFTPLRFMPPELMGYQGRAVVIDPDIFAVGDVLELLNRDMQGKALMCVSRPGHQGIENYFASSVMLLDCAQLTHWHCETQFNEMFELKLDYMTWISLGIELRERIGLLEPEWNHFDVLNEHTRLLHTTRRRTQPWKTGLPMDFTPTAKAGWASRAGLMLQETQRRLLGREVIAKRYKRHPDARLEALFFGLLRECLENGTVSEAFLHEEMRHNHLRHDALKMVEHTAPLPPWGELSTFLTSPR
jgi:hypothetical protein